MGAVGDDGVDALRGGEGGGVELGAHAAGTAPRSGAAREGPRRFVNLRDAADEPGRWVEPRVAVVEAVDVREDHEAAGAAEHRHDGGEHIVVAEQAGRGLDLGVAHGIVFVDDGDDPHFQQAVKGVREVLLLLLDFDILGVQQDLGDGLVAAAEEFVIEVHDAALADRGGGLLEAHARRAPVQAQLVAADGNGTGGYEDDFIAEVLYVGKHAGQPFKGAQVVLPDVVGERGGADLYDQAVLIKSHGKLPFS